MPALAGESAETGVPFRDETGAEARISDFRGKPVILSFWATWCGPCAAEMPILDAWQQKYRWQGLRILPVSQDSGAEALELIRQFYARHGIQNLPIYTDSRARLGSAMGVPGLPTLIFIDASGQEVTRVTGLMDWEAPENRAFIRDFARGRKGLRF